MIKVMLKWPRVKIGCHSSCKSGYVFAIFGRGNRTDVELAARHKSSRKNPKRYREDAETLETIQEVQGHNPVTNEAGERRNSYLKQSDQVRALLSSNGNLNQIAGIATLHLRS